MSITLAAIHAQEALDSIAVARWSPDKETIAYHTERARQKLEDAFKAVHQTPDSGRAKEIGDVFQNHGA